jgi:hypothetical protein
LFFVGILTPPSLPSPPPPPPPSCSVVDIYGAPGDVFSFFDTVYTSENQGQIYNSVTADMTYNEVMTDIVAEFVTNSSSLSTADYLAGMDASVCGDCEMNTRYSFKNAALRNVYGTPMEHINGVAVDGLETMDDWKATLDGLLGAEL